MQSEGKGSVYHELIMVYHAETIHQKDCLAWLHAGFSLSKACTPAYQQIDSQQSPRLWF